MLNVGISPLFVILKSSKLLWTGIYYFAAKVETPQYWACQGFPLNEPEKDLSATIKVLEHLVFFVHRRAPDLELLIKYAKLPSL